MVYCAAFQKLLRKISGLVIVNNVFSKPLKMLHFNLNRKLILVDHYVNHVIASIIFWPKDFRIFRLSPSSIRSGYSTAPAHTCGVVISKGKIESNGKIFHKKQSLPVCDAV